MDRFSFIQSLFKPIQPAGPYAAGAPVRYTEVLPATWLAPYIRCFWSLECTGADSAGYTYPVVADGCVDLIFTCHRSEKLLLAVTGNRYDKYQLEPPFHYFGIRFFPAAIHFFFPLSVSGLSAQTIQAEQFIGPAISFLDEMIFEAGSDTGRIRVAEKWLLANKRDRGYSHDPRFLQSLYNILKAGGTASIGTQVSEYISPRQQRRHFDEYLGISPKDFSRIVRFQQSLNALVKIPPRQRGSRFYEFGYYDQSHFIREFKQLYGDTPKNLFFGGR